MKATLLKTFFILLFLEKFKNSRSTTTTTTTNSASLCDTRLPLKTLVNVSASSDEDVITPNEIQVSWQFECEAQQTLLHQLTLEYCRLPDCSSKETSSTVLTLRNLHNLTFYSLEQLIPNSTYQILFSSPEIIAKYVLHGRTDISVPEPPTDVRLTFRNDIENPVLSWDVEDGWRRFAYFYVTISELLSGIYIYLNDKIDTSICAENTCQLNQIMNLKLKPAVDYRLSVQCCNRKRRCSTPFELIHSVPPRSPGKMSKPVLNPIDKSTYQVLFKSPAQSNGPINEYLVKQTDENGVEQIITVPKNLKLNNTLDNRNFTVNCSTETDQIRQSFQVSIAAVNIEYSFRKNKTWAGEFSEPAHIDLCYSEANEARQKKKQLRLLILWISIAAFVAVVILFLVLYFIYSGTKYFRSVKEEMRKLEIKVLSNERATYVEQLKVDDPKLYNRLQNLELKHVRHVSKLFASKLSTVVETELEVKEEIEKERTVINKQKPIAFSVSTGYTCLPDAQTKL